MDWNESKKAEARLADRTARIVAGVADAANRVEDALRSLDGVVVVDAAEFDKAQRIVACVDSWVKHLYEIEAAALNGQNGYHILSIVRKIIPTVPFDSAAERAEELPPIELAMRAETEEIESSYSFDCWVEYTRAAIEQED